MATTPSDEPVPPFLTDELSRQLEGAHVECAVERLAGIGLQPGNPHGVQVTRCGRCVALAASLPVQWMNTIHLVGQTDLRWLDETVAECRAAGRSPRVEVLPSDLHPALSAALANLGLAQQGFHAAVYGPAREAEVESPRRHVTTAAVSVNDFELFLDVFLAGFGSSPAAKRNMRHWMERPNWRLHLARVNGSPAAAAVFSVHGTLGYLAAAATVPALRGLGCQFGIDPPADRHRAPTGMSPNRGAMRLRLGEPPQHASGRVTIGVHEGDLVHGRQMSVLAGRQRIRCSTSRSLPALRSIGIVTSGDR